MQRQLKPEAWIPTSAKMATEFLFVRAANSGLSLRHRRKKERRRGRSTRPKRGSVTIWLTKKVATSVFAFRHTGLRTRSSLLDESQKSGLGRSTTPWKAWHNKTHTKYWTWSAQSPKHVRQCIETHTITTKDGHIENRSEFLMFLLY